MNAKYKMFISLVLVCVSLLAVLCGCKAEEKKQSKPSLDNLDERLLMVDRNNYTDCPMHDVPLFEYYTPDTITLIRDDAVVAEYPKGNAVYEKILQMHSQSLQANIQNYKDRYQDEMKYPYPHQTKGMVGSPFVTENGLRTALLGRTYLVYTYADDVYAPVYFDINDPSSLSQVVSAQPVLAGESGGPFGFHTSHELWDYLKTL